MVTAAVVSTQFKTLLWTLDFVGEPTLSALSNQQGGILADITNTTSAQCNATARIYCAVILRNTARQNPTMMISQFIGVF
jgi:hypothetical protein